MTATAFVIVSVGIFKLCVVSVSCILVPVIIWIFMHNSFYYTVGGFFMILYNMFLLAMNYRSTKWLKNSLKLTRILAAHDQLTGLANRSLLYQLFEMALAKRNSNSNQIAILFLDLDEFKKINDTLGHEIGDMVLLKFSKKIKSCLRNTDLAARLGGDEFIVMLEEPKPEQIILVAENILKTLEKPMKIEGNEIHISASVGISVYPEDGDTIQKLIKKADMALYQAKKTGKGKYEFYRPELEQ
jgi:diguanylate cyclase (GGDEF)-like protein